MNLETVAQRSESWLPRIHFRKKISYEVNDDRYDTICGDVAASFEGRNRPSKWKYWDTLKVLKPFRHGKVKVEGTVPMEKAGFLSFMFLSWISSKILEFFKDKEGKSVHVWTAAKKESTAVNTARMKRLWEAELDSRGTGKVSLFRVWLRFMRTRLIFVLLALLVNALCAFMAGPYQREKRNQMECTDAVANLTNLVRNGSGNAMSFILNNVVTYVEDGNGALRYGLLLVLAQALSEFFRAVSYTIVWTLGFISGTRSRTGCLGLVYEKLLRLENIRGKQIGGLLNIFVTDSYRIYLVSLNSVYLLSVPAYLTIGLGYSFFLIGKWTLIAAGIFCLCYYLQGAIAKYISKLRAKTVVLTDKRVRKMAEIINNIKLIKMYGWEKSFMDAVMDLRKQEKKYLVLATFCQGVSSAIIPVIPTLSSVITIVAYNLGGNTMEASTIFALIGAMNFMKTIVAIVPWASRTLEEAKVSFKRIQKILLENEFSTRFSQPSNPDNAIEITDGFFNWSVMEEQLDETKLRKKKKTKESNPGFSPTKENGVQMKIDNTKVTLRGFNLEVPKGQLFGVCGPVGCGKSSFLSAILGRIKLVDGAVAINGEVVYAAQQAWIFNETVRENVLFGKPMDEERYKKVVFACGLEPDFKLMENGDMTEVGDRGINLSGGQKQRISLARCVYSDMDIYILDDPLSAVDVHVGRHIFYETIKGLIRGKTILLATHQLQYLKECNRVLVLDNGRILESGTHDELMENDGYYCRMIHTFHGQSRVSVVQPADDDSAEEDETNSERVNFSYTRQISATSEAPIPFDVTPTPSKQGNGKLIEEEEMHAGSVSFKTYRDYMKAVGGYGLSFGVFLIYLLAFGSVTFSDWWINIWLQNLGNGGRQVAGNTTLAPSTESPSSGTSFTVSPADGSTVEHRWSTNGHTITTLFVPSASQAETSDAAATFNVTDSSRAQLTDHFTTSGLTLTSGLSSWFWNATNATAADDARRGTADDTYVLVYGVSTVGIIALVILKGFALSKATLQASSHLHDVVLAKVMRSPMSFFDANPSGRILNRFSKDMDEADVIIPQIIDLFLQISFFVLLSVASSAVVLPYLMAAIVPVFVIFCLLRYLSNPAIRQLKRIENNSRSPLLSHVNMTAQGLPTIVTFKQQGQFIETFEKHLDLAGTVNMLFDCSMRWVGIRLDLISCSLSVGTALIMVLLKNEISPAASAMALSFSSRILSVVQFLVRLVNETESRFTSIERLVDYSKNLKSEAPAMIKGEPALQGWPSRGGIVFTGVYMRYRDNMKPVLKNLRFEIFPEEKVGIVGRTGAGKSSLGVVLFRLVEIYSGQISIDGVDISTLGLQDLRSKLSIIPQDPVLFAGTLRYNLDPFSQYTDEEIWKSLERVHMKIKVLQLEHSLESVIEENGENFSVGERQLICMARALLRDNKILLLDEATASIDTETDAMIQKTIREAFASCTVLTIAHRLHTVLHCDKIMVMKAGKVEEFGTPKDLLSNPTSCFSSMMTANVEH